MTSVRRALSESVADAVDRQRRSHRDGTARAALLAVALALGTAVASSDSVAATDTYYRWKDERGKLVISDRPPTDTDIEYEVVSQRTSMVRRVLPGEGAVPAEVMPRPGNEFEQVDPRLAGKASVEKNPESCARARTNLETLDTSARIRIRDPDTGEMRFLSEEERASQRRQAMDTIRIHCE